MKAQSAKEPLKAQTTYQQDDNNECQEQRDCHDDPNATDLSLYDEDVEQQIDDNYQVMEGCSQRTKRTNDYLTADSELNSNQLISVSAGCCLIQSLS